MADVEIKYNSATIASLSDSGTEVLETSGTYLTDDITVQYTKSGGGASTTNVSLSYASSDPTINVFYVDQNGTAQSWVVDPLYPGGFSATVPSKSLLTYISRSTPTPSNYSNCSLITTKTGGTGNTRNVCIIQAD